MATHSSTLAWKIPWIEDPARLQSMGSQRVRHDRATSLSLSVWETWVQSQAWEDLWRREWQPIPVFLPGKSHGQRSLAGYSPWGHKELDTIEQLFLYHQYPGKPILCDGVVLVAQSCLILCNLIDCSALGSSVHGILQARILEWVAIPPGSS